MQLHRMAAFPASRGMHTSIETCAAKLLSVAAHHSSHGRTAWLFDLASNLHRTCGQMIQLPSRRRAIFGSILISESEMTACIHITQLSAV